MTRPPPLVDPGTRRGMLVGAALVACLIGLGFCSREAGAQAIVLPLTAPDSMVEGTSAVVRPRAEAITGASTSIARVIAVSSDTAILRVSYASGGQRYTAKAPGLVVVTWAWDRTDGQRIEDRRVVRVWPAPPPVVVPPVAPPAPALALSELTIEPVSGAALAVGDSVRFAVVGALYRTAGTFVTRPATAAEIASLPVSWVVSAGLRSSAAGPRAVWVHAVTAGFRFVTACSGPLCQGKGIAVRAADPVPPAPPVVVVDPPVVVPPVVVPVEPGGQEEADGRGILLFGRDTVREGEGTTIRLALADSAAVASIRWVLPTSGSPSFAEAVRTAAVARWPGTRWDDSITFAPYPALPANTVRLTRFDSLISYGTLTVGQLRDWNEIHRRAGYPVGSYGPTDDPTDPLWHHTMDARWTNRLTTWRPGAQPFGVVVVRKDGRRTRYISTLTVLP